MSTPQIVSREDWLKARKAHLKNEKALTRMRDLVSAERRELPWVKVEKQYVFDTTEGKKTLSELFGDNSQLIVHHFMWTYDIDEHGIEHPRDVGCPSCSATADNIGHLVHLHQRDTTLAAVSRAPYAKIAPFHQRMGWAFPWYLSLIHI